MSTVITEAVEEPKPTQGPDAPTVTHYQQLAAQLKSAIAAVMAEIPKFEMSHDLKARFVSVHQSVPPEFINTVTAAVESNETIARVKAFDVDDARNVLQFVEAFRPLVDDAAALAAGLDFTVKAQYARVAASSLDVYAITKRLTRNGDGTIQRIALNMRRDLGRFRVHPRDKTPAPAEG